MGDTEFFEGVRCVLVDKGATPNWRFKTINDIKDSDVSKFFEPLSDKSKDLAI
jgi:enoyl-CoA hydratase